MGRAQESRGPNIELSIERGEKSREPAAGTEPSFAIYFRNLQSISGSQEVSP